MTMPADKLKSIVNRAAIIALIVWLAFALGVGPRIVDSAYEGRGWKYIENMMKRKGEHPVSHYHGYWYRFTALASVVLVLGWAFARCVLSPGFFRRCVGKASADNLGWIRMVTFGILLSSALWEHLPSTAWLPREMFTPWGVLRIVARVPGFPEMLASESALRGFQWTTIAVLLAATVGFLTRVTVPLGALLYLVLVGIFRCYSWAYHTGILPMYVGFVLAFLPCNASWSVDSLLRRRGQPVVSPDQKTVGFGWSCYACWFIIAVALAAAGFSKLRNGGMTWFSADSFRTYIFSNSLTPMEFDFQVAQRYLTDAPDWVFSGMAILAVITQLSCLLMAFSPLARKIIPFALIAVHVNIWLLQNILFFDVLLLQLVFFDFSPLQARIRRALRPEEGLDALSSSADSDAADRLDVVRPAQIVVVAIAGILGAVWVSKFEYYPLSAMQMFSRPDASGEVSYHKIIAHYRDGTEGRAPLEECIPAISDSRYRHMLSGSFQENTKRPALFFTSCIQSWNDRLKKSPPIDSIEVQLWHWTFDDKPRDGVYGRMLKRRVFNENGLVASPDAEARG